MKRGGEGDRTKKAKEKEERKKRIQGIITNTP
jgi:hypothetical protein